MLRSGAEGAPFRRSPPLALHPTRIHLRAMRGLVGCLLLTIGCSTTSTIALVNAPPVEGDIVGGSRDSIFVVTDNGREHEIPRDDISLIDYPGNVHRNAGLAVLAYGGANIAVGLPECEQRSENKTAYCLGLFLPAAIGLGLIVWGLVVEHGQTAAVADTSRPSPQKPRSIADNLPPPGSRPTPGGP